MKKGRHRLAKASGGCSHFADVTVSVSESIGETEIIDLSDTPAVYLDGASLGIEFELKKIKEKKKVTIESIDFTFSDSTPEAVAYAACLAVREALELGNDEYPRFEGREIRFEKDE